MKILTASNILTFARLLGTICLFFLEPMGRPFFTVYTVSGITDVFDGVIARATGTESAFGSRLDSVADLFFYGVMLLKIFPVMWEILPSWIWFIVLGITSVRIVSYSIAFKKTGKFSSLHTPLNKISGILVFMVPYFVHGSYFAGYACLVCAVTAVSGVSELILYVKS